MIFINQKLKSANNEMKEVLQRMSCPTFDYNRLDNFAKMEYHALVAQCELFLEKDKEKK